MKRVRLLGALVGATMLLVAGCKDGNQGPAGATGPKGDSGTPQPIRVLMLGAQTKSVIQGYAGQLLASGGLPQGSEIDCVTAATTIPTLAELNTFDAVMVWSDFALPDRDSLSTRLREYVDAGGGLVLGYGVFVEGFSVELTGALMASPYSPFATGPAIGPSGARTLDPASIDIPYHPIFSGVNPNTFGMIGFFLLGNPPLNTGATLLALDSTGANAVAINAAGNIIGVNIFVREEFNANSTSVIRLYANALMIVGGGI